MKIVGWKWREWTVPLPCERCTDFVTQGIVNANDDMDPPLQCLCKFCHIILMINPEEFEKGTQ